jgi:phage terminase Nu1 subunit (DNA packaging protein)
LIVAMGSPDRLTQSGLARSLGVKRQAIHDLVKRGVIHQDADGLIDVAAATVAIAENLRADAKTVAAVMTDVSPGAHDTPTESPETGSDTEPMGATSFHVARTLREAAEARIAQLRLMKMAGQLVDAEKVRRVVTTWSATARNAFERIPDKLAERLAAESLPEICHTLLAAEIDLVLSDLAAGAAAMALEDDPDGRP